MDTETLLAWSTPIATGGLLIVTVAYSYFTYLLVKVGRNQRFEQIRPRINAAVIATQRGQFFVLRLENVGLSAAIEFRASLDKVVCRTYGDKAAINETPIFQRGLPAFLPGTPIDIGLGVSHTYLGDDVNREVHPARFTVLISYKFDGREFREEIPIEVHDLYADTAILHTELSDITNALKNEIAKPLKEISSELKRR